ncbi:methyltransferase domain-containing protein [uncultured Jannaschia sp.]|uniref:class I SAM-dependent DNA methyltransferase n=1 Tax=uncultured Jannaschia sp. TaxID=293347 RepID=UPI0026228662|nr:methyltransferase domain-containing protein [uncultured Jannaschia sp.]
MTDAKLRHGLWTARPPDEARALYAQWADRYDADLTEAGYATPRRLAAMLAAHLPARDAPILDFGCGTGLSGEALAAEGFAAIDGTDITPEMRAQAESKRIYRRLFPATPGEIPDLSDYAAIGAAGVISLGAAPPETLGALVAAMTTGTLLAFSYNDATLQARPYLDALADVQAEGRARLIAAEHGPHLPGQAGVEGSTVHLLRRLG